MPPLNSPDLGWSFRDDFSGQEGAETQNQALRWLKQLWPQKLNQMASDKPDPVQVPVLSQGPNNVVQRGLTKIDMSAIICANVSPCERKRLRIA